MENIRNSDIVILRTCVWYYHIKDVVCKTCKEDKPCYILDWDYLAHYKSNIDREDITWLSR